MAEPMTLRRAHAGIAALVRLRVTRNSAAMLLSRAAMAAAAVVTLPLLYGRLGEHRFGVWILLSGFVTILALTDLGLSSMLTREVARTAADGGDRRLDALLGVGLAWGIGLGLVVLAVTAACGPVAGRLFGLGAVGVEAWHAMLWLSAGVLAGGVELPWRAVLEGSQRFEAVAWIAGGSAVLGAGLAVAAVRSGGLVLLAASSAATAVMRAAATVATARRYRPQWRPRPALIRAADLRRAAGYGLPVQVSNAAALTNTEVDALVLAGCFGPAMAGPFGVGTRLLNLLRLPPGLVLTALFPVAVEGAARHGPAWLDRFYVKATAALAACIAPGAAALVVCADPLVRLWLGHPMPWAAANLAILAPSHALSLVAGAATVVTRAEGRPGRETRYVVLSAVLNVALTAPLLWLAGPLGVSVATAVAVTASTAYFVGYFHRTTGRPFGAILRVTGRAVLAAAAAGALVAAVAGDLPDGPGRAGAAAAVGSRGALVLAIAAALLFLARDRRRELAP
ncbi:lipopolysaccharide biosynthesis protein [Dactylosporangium sp. CA-092794]|uniref:lipopolysaccharide biosynthesis protein n=1 Tax=Dactylosporangium sp. CA-092794 TaxID=3239929 RepID=UPI003D8A4D73